MRSDKEMKIVASIITIMSLFFFYVAYDSEGMVNKLGFTIVGIWGIFNVFGSYIWRCVTKILKRIGDRKGDMN